MKWILWFCLIYLLISCISKNGHKDEIVEIQVSSPFGSLQIINLYKNYSGKLQVGRASYENQFEFLEKYQKYEFSVPNSSERFTIDSMVASLRQVDLVKNAPLDDNFHIKVFVDHKIKVDTYGYSLGLFRVFKIVQKSLPQIDKRSDFFTLIRNIEYQ